MRSVQRDDMDKYARINPITELLNPHWVLSLWRLPTLPFDARKLFAHFQTVTEENNFFRATWKDSSQLEWVFLRLVVHIGDDDDRNTTGAQWYLRDYLQPIIPRLRGKVLSKPSRTPNKLHFMADFFRDDSYAFFLIEDFQAANRYMYRGCWMRWAYGVCVYLCLCLYYVRFSSVLRYYFLATAAGNSVVKRN